MTVQPWESWTEQGSAAANPPIVVGVDDSAASLLAAEWAAREAVHLGCCVQLVHAYSANVLHEPLTKPIGRERAEMAFETARQHLADPFYDGLGVTTVACQGEPRRVLVRAAETAQMLVVGRRHTGKLADLLLATTSMACAVRAVTPVTVVPTTWDPAAFGKAAVVVGIDGSARSGAALGHAFQLAVRRQWRLTVVLALDALDHRDPSNAIRDNLRADGHKVLDDALSDWRVRFPGADVTAVLDDRSPVDALADHAAEADRVVIGGRGHGLVTGALLGSVARSVLRQLPGPVTVVHTRKDQT